MRYQNPQLLYFLFAIAIPILIHLFNFRKHKTIYFSSIRFLKEIKEDKRKRSNLKNLLILASRILAISFLVLAFAKPYIPNNKTNNSAKNIVIYLDNSFSMDAEGEEGRLLDVAKEKAISICNSYPAESKFWIINNDFEPQNNKSRSAKNTIEQIVKINSSPLSKTISQVVNKQKNLITSSTHLYVISDMQKENLELEQFISLDSNTTLFFVPLKANQLSNLSVDTCWIESPIFRNNEPITIFSTITNQTATNIDEQVVFLEINNKQKSQQYISLKENESKTISFTFIPSKDDVLKGLISLNDNPITFDNKCYFTLKNNNKLNILCLNQKEKNSALSSLFNTDTSLFNYQDINVKEIDYNELKDQDLIIINEVNELSSGLSTTLNTFVENGGFISIIPPSNIDINQFNISLKELGINAIFHDTKELNTSIENINLDHPIFSNVFDGKLKQVNYPSVNKYYPISTQSNSNSSTLLSLENKEIFLAAFTKEKGSVFLFNSPLKKEFNNFTKHALFVPTLLNIATSSIRAKQMYNVIEPNDYFTSNKILDNSEIVHLTNDNTDIIPTQRTQLGKQLFYTNNQVKTNGYYNISVNNKNIDAIAYNYSTKESKSELLNSNDIKNHISKYKLNNTNIIEGDTNSLITTITENQNGKEFWKIALILSLLFFAIEILLIKIVKL